MSSRITRIKADIIITKANVLKYWSKILIFKSIEIESMNEKTENIMKNTECANPNPNWCTRRI